MKIAVIDDDTVDEEKVNDGTRREWILQVHQYIVYGEINPLFEKIEILTNRKNFGREILRDTGNYSIRIGFRIFNIWNGRVYRKSKTRTDSTELLYIYIYKENN